MHKGDFYQTKKRHLKNTVLSAEVDTEQHFETERDPCLVLLPRSFVVRDTLSKYKGLWANDSNVIKIQLP